MDQSFKMALEVNDLSRDLLYLVERYRSEPDSGPSIFDYGFEPRLRRTLVILADCCRSNVDVLKKPMQSEKPGTTGGEVASSRD